MSNKIACPACGEKFDGRAAVEDDDGVVRPGEHEIECPYCDGPIDLDVDVQLLFRIRPRDDE